MDASSDKDHQQVTCMKDTCTTYFFLQWFFLIFRFSKFRFEVETLGPKLILSRVQNCEGLEKNNSLGKLTCKKSLKTTVAFEPVSRACVMILCPEMKLLLYI
jgi:hypothetical protein